MTYQGYWDIFIEYCDSARPTPYNPWNVEAAPDLFMLFAGHMYVRGKNGTIGQYATAFNFHIYHNEKLPQVWKGGVIKQVITAFEAARLAKAGRERRQVAGLRVALPVPGLIKSLLLLERLLDTGSFGLAMKAATWIIMLLFLFRADTTGGFRNGDVYFNEEGSLMVTVRQVKCGRAHITPFTKSIPPPPRGNETALKTFELLRRITDISRDENRPEELTAVFMEIHVKKQAAREMTKFVQKFLPKREIGVADESYIASHSARITGANHIMYSAGANYTKLRRWGGWKSEVSMQSYIDHTTVKSRVYKDFYFWMEEGYNEHEFETGPNAYDNVCELNMRFV